MDEEFVQRIEKNEQISGLIIKYWKSTLTAEEKVILDNWLVEDEGNKKFLDRSDNKEKFIKDLDDLSAYNPADGYKRFCKLTAAEGTNGDEDINPE